MVAAQGSMVQGPLSWSLSYLPVPEMMAGPRKMDPMPLERISSLLSPPITISDSSPEGRGDPLAGSWWGVGTIESLWGVNPKALCKVCWKVCSPQESAGRVQGPVALPKS